MNWSTYFERTKTNPASAHLVKAVELLSRGEGKTALDLGCGAGRDSRFLSEHGYLVMAVDADESAAAYIEPISNTKFIHSRFEDFHFGQYDLINASYSLPFAGVKHFDQLWRRIGQALNPGGIFVGELFGDRDGWNSGDDKLAFQRLDQVQKMVDGLEVLTLDEEEADRPTAAGGMKRWHVFHLILRKKVV